MPVLILLGRAGRAGDGRRHLSDRARPAVTGERVRACSAQVRSWSASYESATAPIRTGRAGRSASCSAAGVPGVTLRRRVPPAHAK